MNEQHDIWWNLLDKVTEFLALAVAGGLGWLARKFSKVEERMDAMEKDFLQRDQEAATNIAVLQAYHQSNLQRLDSIDEKAKEINTKLDSLIVSMTNRRD